MEGSISQPDIDVPRRRSDLTTFCYAGPLMGCGVIWLGTGLLQVPNAVGAMAMQLIGGFYLVSGGLLFTSWKGAPKLAMVAWAPFFLGVPIGTVLALVAFRGLKKWNEPPAPAEMQPSRNRFSMVEVTTRAFIAEFGACQDATGSPLSISRDLYIPAGTFARFLDDLRIDHGLSISGADAAHIDSLPDLIELLKKRHFAEGSLD